MKTKAEFQQLIAAAMSNYPTAAQFFRAGDPRVLANLDAMAAMLALISSEVDTAAMEPFTKARDVTVLADGAIKGVLPFGRATRAKIAVLNGPAALTINTGRRLRDTQGRVWVVTVGVTLAASASGFITAIQQEDVSFNHTITASAPFYRINVPQPDGGLYVSAIRVVDALAEEYEYTPDFINVEVGAKIFHLETDEDRVLNIQFGATDIAGNQPGTGEVLTVVVSQTEGALELATGSLFTFDLSYSPFEGGAKLTLDEILTPGAAPMDVSTMREVVSYPSIYDSSAVYLGNFDFLIRRQLSPLRFLSVWNEQIEEAVRGASIDNINRLFVAAKADGVDDADLQDQISAIINRADDSLRITFVAPVDTLIPVAITAHVSSVHDFAAVASQIRDIVLAEYGPDSAFAKRGRTRIQYKRLYNLIEDGVLALQGAGSDMQITITDVEPLITPENYRFVDESSLTITVDQA